MAPTARTQYRALVADVAARAKAILPTQVNGRIEKAVKLVLAGDVEPQADGTVTVYSATDATRRYVLQGPTCTCTDFERGQAPQGWCAHRIAAGIAKRVGELLPQLPEILEPWPDNDLEPEAPAAAPVPAAPAPTRERAGMRLEAQVMMDGRLVKVALWGPDDAEVQARLQAVLAQHPAPAAPASPQGQPQGPDGWCATHQTALKLNHGKDGRTWLSHRLPDGSWCKGR